MNPIIRVENLSKQYRIGASKPQYQTLRDALTDAARKPLSWFNGNGKSEEPAIWALRDVSFEVMPGEVVGVIGRNGAGKSTLLKLLSRITEPTSGKIDLYGRVGSLLEVGTGFHAELTGRENIYLNGAILGMQRAEITSKLDEIIAFAQIEQFVDTPVKRYSSGMYVRLAFAVAAHLTCEVLIIDEVLSVGDVAFKNRCMGKIRGVASSGRTVLLVSHDMQAVGELCSRAICVDRGVVIKDGGPRDTIQQYLAMNSGLEQNAGKAETANFTITKITCYGKRPTEQVEPLGEINFELDIVPKIKVDDLSLQVLIRSEEGECLLGFDSVDFGAVRHEVVANAVRFNLRLESCPLPPGKYWLDVYVKNYFNRLFESIERVYQFEVQQKPIYGQRLYDPKWHGRTIAHASFSCEGVNE